MEEADISRLLPKTNQTWNSGRIYKRYDTTDRTCFNQDIVSNQIEKYSCFVIYNDSLYLCLGNNNDTASTVDPQSIVSIDGDVEEGGDSYIWVKIGDIPVGNDFENSNTFFPNPQQHNRFGWITNRNFGREGNEYPEHQRFPCCRVHPCRT